MLSNTAIGSLVSLLLVVSAASSAELAPTACRLLSAMEVENVVRVRVGQGSPRVNTERVSACFFEAGGIGTVSVLLRRNTSKDWIADQKRRMSGPGSFRPTGGLGDAAFVLDAREKGAAICVFQGGYYLQVSVFRLGGARAVQPAAEALARMALARLRQPG